MRNKKESSISKHPIKFCVEKHIWMAAQHEKCTYYDAVLYGSEYITYKRSL